MSDLQPSAPHSQATSRTAWFEDARFGLFIHWNACAALEGRFDGEPVRQSEYGEWLRARNRVPRAEWDNAIKKMHITPDVVDGWAEAAKEAGMKYVIFVSKHHDGLAYWPSTVSDYTLNNLAGVNFDIAGRLKEACDMRGLKLCFYYSHWHDWEDVNGWGNFWDFNSDDPKQFEGREDFFFYSGEGYRDNLTPEQFNTYWHEKSMAQVRELMEKYQPALFWFDCWLRLEDTNMTTTQVQEMLSMIRSTDSSCIVNSRLGISQVGGEGGVDYETLGDNEFPHRQKIDHPWESAVTFALSWGYSRDDQNWRPATYFIRNLVRNISLGGNLAINFGPMADGRAPQEALACMRQIGDCIRGNKEGFYGCGYTPFEDQTHDWGLTTLDESNNALYLHVFDWPVDGIIRVNGLKTQVASATLTGTGQTLDYTQNGPSVHVKGPLSAPVAYDTVIRLHLREPIQVDNETIGEMNGGGISLQASQANIVGVSMAKPYEGSTKLPFEMGGWNSIGASASWSIYIPSSGSRAITVCYASSVETAGQSFTVSAGPGLEISATVKATQLNWSEFRPFAIGEINFPSAGYYTFNLKPFGPLDRELFKLLWIHVGAAGK